MKKLLCIILSCMLIFCNVCICMADTAGYNDIDGHWASETIEKWSKFEIINGSDGNFRPNAAITRGEFAVVVDRIMNYATDGNNSFKDLDDNFYTESILKLNNAGVMLGFDDLIRPRDFITREEAAVMLCRAFFLEGEKESDVAYADENDISIWAMPYMAHLINKGYLSGSDNLLKPQSNITRAESVTIINNIVGLLCNKENYYSDLKQDKLCIINTDGVEIADCSFTGNVIVTENGSAELTNVSICGKLLVENEHASAVVLKNCTVNNVDSVGGAVETVVNSDVPTVPIETTVSPTKPSDSSGSSGSQAGTSGSGNSSGSSNEPTETTEPTEDKTEPTEPTEVPTEPTDEPNNEDEALEPVITTTLEEGAIQKSSKNVFDVFAKDYSGNKTECSVQFNDVDIEPTWDDDSKLSFTLDFTEAGENIVNICAVDSENHKQTLTYTITYEPYDYGGVIGSATFCIEAFTVGGGYIVAPQTIDIKEGVNVAYALDEVLNKASLQYMNTGSLDGGFYLAKITGINELNPVIPQVLKDSLVENGFDCDESLFTEGNLGEFDFTQGSGWMYCVNGIFPNVGFSDYYLQDGDVVRVQFTLAYGADIGGSSAMGYDYATDYFETVSRDKLTEEIARKGIDGCMDYIDTITKVNLTQSEADMICESLN